MDLHDIKRAWQHMQLKSAFNPNRRIELYKALAEVVENGISLIDALKIMSKELARIKDPQARIIKELLNRVEGRRTDQAMSIGQAFMGSGKRVKPLVPADEGLIILSADEASRLDQGFKEAARLLERKQQLMKTIHKHMLSPIIQVGMFGGLLLYFKYGMIPAVLTFAKPYEWPESMQMVAALSYNAEAITGALAGMVVLVFLLITQVAPRWISAVRNMVDRKVPPFNLFAQFQGAVLLSTISGFLKAGVPFSDALKMMRNFGTPYSRWMVRRIIRSLDQGREPADALMALPIVPVQHHWLLKTYGLMNDMTESMDIISEKMMASVSKTIDRFFGILSAVTMVLVALGIVSMIGGLMVLVADKL